jgi:hypothetical protein
MQPHNPNSPEQEPLAVERQQPDASKGPDVSKGYEAKDARVSGVLVFLVALSIFALVTGGLAFGFGKLLNMYIAKQDGPPSRWVHPVDVRSLGNMPSSPAMENKFSGMAGGFPTPRVQTDDGSQDVADLHTREDLLLDNYSWVDPSQGKVRIPIERAMELLAQRGLPLAPAVDHTPLLTGERAPVVAVPLTDGFARTGYEQEQAAHKR